MKKLKIILIFLLIIIAGGACFFAVNRTLFESENHYKAHEEALEKLIISDYSTDDAYTNLATECKDYITEYKKALDKKDMIKCPKLNKLLTTKEESLLKYDKAIVSDVATRLKNFKNTEYLFEYEKANIQAAESEAEDLVKSEDYNLAYKKYNDALSSLENISTKDTIDIMQYDFSEFPKVKLYLDSTKLEEALGSSIDGTNFKIVEKIGDSYEEIPIDNYGTTSDVGGLNIDLLADVSASMANYLLDVKDATSSFVENIDMTKNKVGLMSFSDYINRNSSFTNDKTAIDDAIYSLETQNMTCFYDALAVSLSDTNNQTGAKCIVAFTDGRDNMSRYNNYNSICNLAKSYGIPVYIVGIGDDSPWGADLQSISEQTGGYYKNIDTYNIDQEMTAIYNDIQQNQEQLYYIEYTDKNKDKSQKRELYIEYNDGNKIVRNQLKDTIEDPSEFGANTADEETKKALENTKKVEVASFIRQSNICYFDAINKRDLSLVQDFYDVHSEGGRDMLSQVKGNIKTNIEDEATFEFYDYEIKDVTIESDNTYKVRYYQKYKVYTPNKTEVYEAESTDTVVEKNGSFYLIGYNENYKRLTNDTTNKLNDSNYQN